MSNSIGLYRALHRRGRIAPEARLKRTYDWLANARQHSLGLGGRADPVPHLITLGIKKQASTATIYAHRYDGPNDETSGLLGGREKNAPSSWNFSIDVASAWERTFNEMATDGTRKIALRSAMTMSPDFGGVFDALLGLTRYGLGGRAGDGRQFVSWIRYEDFIAAIHWLIDRDDVEGVVNLAAPNPLPNADFIALPP
jgi:NAD dependent epimerase/dehydratase family enzyme